MVSEESPKVICVTGAHSKVGKTALCSILVRHLKGFGAIKFTKTPLYTSITDDQGIINMKNTDTARISASGAEKVVWVRSSRENLGGALDMALDSMSRLEGIVVEGNSPVDFLTPHLLIFIIGKDGQIKPPALNLSKRADIIIVNSEKTDQPPPFLPRMLKTNTKVFYIDLKTEKGGISDFLACVKKRIHKETNT